MARPNLHTTETSSVAGDQRLLQALGLPFAQAAETSSTGFALVDAAGTVIWASAAFSRLTRVTGALLGAPLPQRLSERFRLADGEAMFAFSGVKACTLELLESRSGAALMMHVARLDDDRRIVVAIAADPDRSQGATGALDEITIDPLTRLGNRHLLEARLNEPSEPSATWALIVVGLDGFTALNETLGRVACDAVLALIADRLRRSCRSDDLVVRLGGDTFAILHDVSQGAASTGRISTRVATLLDEPVSNGEITTRLAISIGIATQGKATTRKLDLIEHGLSAMAAAKRAGGATWREYDPGSAGAG